jgi:hypothetical protein
MLLTNSNGECRDGSSNKTPHIVVATRAPPLVAHTLQHLRESDSVRKEAGRMREQTHCIASGVRIQERGVRLSDKPHPSEGSLLAFDQIAGDIF